MTPSKGSRRAADPKGAKTRTDRRVANIGQPTQHPSLTLMPTTPHGRAPRPRKRANTLGDQEGESEEYDEEGTWDDEEEYGEGGGRETHTAKNSKG